MSKSALIDLLIFALTLSLLGNAFLGTAVVWLVNAMLPAAQQHWLPKRLRDLVAAEVKS